MQLSRRADRARTSSPVPPSALTEQERVSSPRPERERRPSSTPPSARTERERVNGVEPRRRSASRSLMGYSTSTSDRLRSGAVTGRRASLPAYVTLSRRSPQPSTVHRPSTRRVASQHDSVYSVREQLSITIVSLPSSRQNETSIHHPGPQEEEERSEGSDWSVASPPAESFED